MITDKTQFNKKQVKYPGKFQTDENLIQFADLLRQKNAKGCLIKNTRLQIHRMHERGTVVIQNVVSLFLFTKYILSENKTRKYLSHSYRYIW